MRFVSAKQQRDCRWVIHTSVTGFGRHLDYVDNKKCDNESLVVFKIRSLYV